MGAVQTVRRRTAEQRELAATTAFMFASTSHARRYRYLTVVLLVMGPIGLLAAWRAPGNFPVLVTVIVVSTIVNAVHLTTWVRLCRRADPPVPKVHYLMGGMISPMTLRALRGAGQEVRDRKAAPMAPSLAPDPVPGR